MVCCDKLVLLVYFCTPPLRALEWQQKRKEKGLWMRQKKNIIAIFLVQ